VFRGLRISCSRPWVFEREARVDRADFDRYAVWGRILLSRRGKIAYGCAAGTLFAFEVRGNLHADNSDWPDRIPPAALVIQFASSVGCREPVACWKASCRTCDDSVDR
jgi:hypothetical protein